MKVISLRKNGKKKKKKKKNMEQYPYTLKMPRLK